MFLFIYAIRKINLILILYVGEMKMKKVLLENKQKVMLYGMFVALEK